MVAGRKIPGRPLQKLVGRQFDAIKKDLKEQANKTSEDEDRRVCEPLNEDLSMIMICYFLIVGGIMVLNLNFINVQEPRVPKTLKVW